MAAEQLPGSKIDTSVPHSARIWNYWLGGIDNYAVDRAAGDQYMAVFPEIVEIARVVRAFLGRAVRYLVGDAGIRQLVDIGTGLPTAENTHELAQRVAPECRIVYVDNDPLVLVHARALLTSSPVGATDYLDADLRQPDVIVREASRLLDFSQPVALVMMGVLGHIADYHQARSIVDRLVAAVPSGSYLAISDSVGNPPEGARARKGYADTGAVPYTARTPEQFAGYFEGLDLVEPGVVPSMRWRPEAPVDGARAERLGYAGVARKP